jgi:hypothetical protein
MRVREDFGRGIVACNFYLSSTGGSLNRLRVLIKKRKGDILVSILIGTAFVATLKNAPTIERVKAKVAQTK